MISVTFLLSRYWSGDDLMSSERLSARVRYSGGNGLGAAAPLEHPGGDLLLGVPLLHPVSSSAPNNMGPRAVRRVMADC